MHKVCQQNMRGLVIAMRIMQCLNRFNAEGLNQEVAGGRYVSSMDSEPAEMSTLLLDLGLYFRHLRSYRTRNNVC